MCVGIRARLPFIPHRTASNLYSLRNNAEDFVKAEGSDIDDVFGLYMSLV
jgi:hypothetical protein